MKTIKNKLYKAEFRERTQNDVIYTEFIKADSFCDAIEVANKFIDDIHEKYPENLTIASISEFNINLIEANRLRV